MKYKLEDKTLTLLTTNTREAFLLGKIANKIEAHRRLAPKAESWLSICDGGTAHISIDVEALTNVLLSELI